MWAHNSSAFEAELLEGAVNSVLSPNPFVEAGEGGHSTRLSVVTTSEDSCDTNAVVNRFFPTSLHNMSFSVSSGISWTLNHNVFFFFFNFIHLYSYKPDIATAKLSVFH